ncbi:MAG: carboxymuconolactone decarboxylase family protein [Oligoflexales bacterium]|nr:carboxymuconolactone decarboxylase family protein [Oligoflexales bacterium]
MKLQEVREKMPNFGKDIKLNLESLLGSEEVSGLSSEQTTAIALACAYAEREMDLAFAIKSDLQVSDELDEAAKGASSIMAMNNIYYRSMHLIEDKELSQLPARLRMNIISKHGIAKVNFELMCLAVSALSGCGMCINAHIQELRKQGIANEGIHSTIRIAAVVHATKQVLSLE